MSRIEGCLNETSGWPRAKYRVSFLALQRAEEGNKHTQKSSTIQRNYFWRKKKLKDNSWWRTFLTNWGRYTLCLTTPLTCASVRGMISWVFLMFHCLKESFAFLKYHLNQETGKRPDWATDVLYTRMSMLQWSVTHGPRLGLLSAWSPDKPWPVIGHLEWICWRAMCTASRYPDLQFYIDEWNWYNVIKPVKIILKLAPVIL